MSSPVKLGRMYAESCRTGKKLRADVQKRVDKEMKRTCGYKECDKSLAFHPVNKNFCSSRHNTEETRRQRSYRKAIKARYNERHNIKRKTVKRNINYREGLPPTEDTLFYENYKEPLKPVEKSKGFGYYGTIALSQDREHVQCHLCGHLYKSLSGHAKAHKISIADYKKMFGLSASASLVGESVREARQRVVLNGKMGVKSLPEHLKEYNRKVQSGEVKHKGTNTWSLQRRNKEGNCPDQVLERIKDLADSLGKPPTEEEFRDHYHNRYITAIRFQHGTFGKALKKAVGATRAELRNPNKERLLESLIEFQEIHGRIPLTSDFNRGILRDRGVYNRQFGSLNNARVEAGLNAILPMGMGVTIEVTPAQYVAYKSTGIIPGYEKTKDAERSKRWRLRRKGVTV